MGKYQFTNEIGYSSYGYYIENFPEINEFTLVNGSESTEVKLTASNSGDVLTAEDSGISVRFYSMSKGSRVLAYEIYEDKSDFENILGIKFPNISYRSLELGPGMEAFQVYDENGNKIFMNGYHSDTGPDGLSTVMFLRTEHGEKISKMEADYIGGVVGTDFTAKIMAAEDVPVPADGEEITFNDGLLLYDRNGLTSKLTAIKRQGNEITIYTNSEYIGEHIENTDIYINWNGGLGSNMSGWTGHRIFNINGDEEFIKLYIDAIYYKINGSWEITFE